MSENENNRGIRSVTMSTKIDVPVSIGSLEYAAGVDPKETWLAVTKDDMASEEYEAIRQKHLDMIKKGEPTQEFQNKLKKHLDECLRLYQGVMNMKGDIVRPYIDGRTFNFVLGMPGTGGTTLYHGLSDAYGWPWNNLLLSMTHNLMPNGKYSVVSPHSEYDMGWRLPWNFHSMMFELCQFLVYANNEAPDSEHLFIKSSALSYAVKFLNYVFGERAHYYITTRHPGAIVMSSGKEEITREDHIENMAIWTNLYSSLIRECRPVGPVTVVEYGQGLTDAINAAFEKTKFGSRLEDTSFFEYDDYDKDFYASDDVKDMFAYVKASWKLFDLDFPLPEQCI